MKLSVVRSRLQFESQMVFERPLVVEVPPEALVVDLKRLIWERQMKLSTVSERQRKSFESPVCVTVEAQVLVMRHFRDAHMRGVVLEDQRPLADYGLCPDLEKNYFLKRSNDTAVELLLIDKHFLTPSQHNTLKADLHDRDYHGFRRSSMLS